MAQQVAQGKTNITIYAGVPLRDDFKNTVLWKDKSSLDKWLDQYKVEEISNSSYQRTEVQIDAPFAYSDLQNANYVRVQNNNAKGAQTERTWYGFIDNITYINNGLTQISWSVDPLTTFQFEWKLPNSYIERGHVNRWADAAHTKPLWSRTAEAVGVDDNSFIFGQQPIDFNPAATTSVSGHSWDVNWLVIITKPMLDSSNPNAKGLPSYGSLVGTPTPYNVFVVPYDNAGMIAGLYINPSTTSSLYPSISLPGGWSVSDYITAIGKSQTFAGTNNNVVSMYTTNYWGLPYTVKSIKDPATGEINAEVHIDGDVWPRSSTTIGALHKAYDIYSEQVSIPKFDGTQFNVGLGLLNIRVMPRFVEQFNTFKFDGYDDLISALRGLYHATDEVKLYQYPFTAIELSNGRGGMMTYRPENFTFTNGNKFNLIAYRFGSLAMNNHTAMGFTGYLYESINDPVEMATRLQTAMIDEEANDLPLILDTYDMYLNGHKNTIAQNRASFAMSRTNTFLTNANSLNNLSVMQGAQSANVGVSNTLRNQTTAVNNNNSIANTNATNALAISKNSASNNFRSTTADINAGVGIINGAAGGAVGGIGGMLAGAGMGALSGGLGIINADRQNDLSNQMTQMSVHTSSQITQNGVNAANANAANANAAALATLGNSQAAAKQAAQNNVSTSNKIATNNYEMQMASINAGLRDMRNYSETLAQQGLNTEFDWGNDNFYNLVSIRGITAKLFRNAEMYFQQFGYTDGNIHNLGDYIKTRTRFNYVKTQNAIVLGTFSVQWQKILQMIFDNGVTFWHDPSYMYDWYSPNNEVTYTS